MDTQKETLVSTTIDTAKADPTTSQPTIMDTRIQWADTSRTARPDLEAKFEAMRARNWITDRMVEQYQKHWHCGREAALERLLEKTGK
jgi:hypothetical protein